MRIAFLLLISVVLHTSCTEDQNSFSPKLDTQLAQRLVQLSPDATLDYFILPHSYELDQFPADAGNDLNSYKVKLGRKLFYETGLGLEANHTAGMQSYSCSSCHIPSAGFTPGNVQGIGDGGMGFGLNGEGRSVHPDYNKDQLDIQSIRPLSLVNVGFVKNTFWNGQFGGGHINIDTDQTWDLREDTRLNHLGLEAIETQNINGFKSHRFTMNKNLAEAYGYAEDFKKAFPHLEEEYLYSPRSASYALSAYIRTITASRAPFQYWLRGQTDAMNEEEKEGALLFFGKAQCYKCHYEKNLGSHDFHALGTLDMDQNGDCFSASPDDRRNLGRGGFTLKDADLYKFRVPGLYNVSDYSHYFHGASKSSLEDVIEYKLAAEPENPRVDQARMSSKLHRLSLSEDEKSQLILFLSSALRDPDLARYAPEEVGSGNCFPNNDSVSRQDIGCD